MPLPSVETILFDHLEAERKAKERAPSLLPDKLHANASSAGACARQVAFRVAGTEASNPITGDALFNFYLGDAIHDKIQTALLAKIPDAQKEVNGVIEDFITVRADLLYPAEDGLMVCTEIKSVSDFAFKLITGKKLKSNGQWNKKDQQAEGPKRENILQVGISARALGASYIGIVYARKTAAKDEPIIAEYRFRINELDGKIDEEIKRLKTIVQYVENGLLPPREFEGVELENVEKIKWPCAYCSFLDKCSKLGAGVVQIEPKA